MGLVLAFNKANAQPNFDVAAAISGTLESGQELSCTYTVVRCRPSNVTVRWYSYADTNGTDQVLLATAATYTLTGTEVGRYIRAIVTATNPVGTVTSTTAYSVAVTTGDPPEPPTITSPAAITGTPAAGQELTVTASFDNASSVTYQWYSYSTEPVGSPPVGDDEVPLGTANTQLLSESEAGRWIVAVVTGTNAVNVAVTGDSIAMEGADPYAPIPPTAYDVPAYDATELTPVYCNSGDDLQAKINSLVPGNILILQAGATWTGKYTISASVATGTDWIYIVSSQLVNLPEGTRVSEDDAASMAKITSSSGSYGTFNVSSGAKKVRIVGLEIEKTNTSSFAVGVGWNSVGEGAPYDWTGITQADEIIYDRCWVHGGTTTAITNGIAGYAVKQWAITECLVTDIHSNFTESHGVYYYGSEGPQKLHNSRIEAAGINVFFGDNAAFSSAPTFGLKTPKDVTITKNHIVKPLEWNQNLPEYNGNNWIVKNLLEIKFGERIHIEGNVIEHSWVDAQAGWLVLINAIPTAIRDVKVCNNVMRNGIGGFQITPATNNSSANSRLERLLIENNVLYDLKYSGSSRQTGVQISIDGSASVDQEINYFTYRHNTCTKHAFPLSAYNIFYSGTSQRAVCNNLRLYNNIAPAGSYGIQTPTISGLSLDERLAVVVGSGAVYNNLIYGYSTVYDYGFEPQSGDDDVAYDNIWIGPNASTASAELLVGFTDTTYDDIADFALTSESPGYQAGAGGVDVGVDVTALAAAINASDF